MRFFLALALLLSFTAAAQARVVVGESCTQLGTSTMTTDQQSIATCLKDKSGSLVWKSMTSGSSGRMSYKELTPVCSIEGNGEKTCALPTEATHVRIQAECYAGYRNNAHNYFAFVPASDLTGSIQDPIQVTWQSGDDSWKIDSNVSIWPIPANATQVYIKGTNAGYALSKIKITPLQAY